MILQILGNKVIKVVYKVKHTAQMKILDSFNTQHEFLFSHGMEFAYEQFMFEIRLWGNSGRSCETPLWDSNTAGMYMFCFFQLVSGNFSFLFQ